MLNCLLFEKFDLHYTLCHFDSILLHYAKLLIRQSIDREQIFDVTFENPPLKNPAYATEPYQISECCCNFKTRLKTIFTVARQRPACTIISRMEKHPWTV